MSDYSFIYESDTNANNLQNQLLADLDNTSVATMIGANIVDANDAYNVTITYLEDESGSNDYEMVVAIEDDRQTVARSLYDGIVTEMSSPNNLTPTAISVSASSGTNTPGTWAGMVTMSPVAPQSGLNYSVWVVDYRAESDLQNGLEKLAQAYPDYQLLAQDSCYSEWTGFSNMYWLFCTSQEINQWM